MLAHDLQEEPTASNQQACCNGTTCNNGNCCGPNTTCVATGSNCVNPGGSQPPSLCTGTNAFTSCGNNFQTCCASP